MNILIGCDGWVGWMTMDFVILVHEACIACIACNACICLGSSQILPQTRTHQAILLR